MTMRITQATTAALMSQDIDTSYDAYESTAAQVASGLAITQPSDNPAGTVQIMSYNGQIARLSQYQNNATDGLAWLGTAQGTLESVTTSLQQVRTLVQQAANGTTDASGRQAIANQVATLQSSLLSDANTTYLGRPVFGGTTGGNAAYDANGNYIGDSGSVTRTVASGTQVQVNVTGPNAFGSGSTSVFAVLSQIQSDLTSNNQAQINNLGSSDLTALDNAMSTVSNATATVGANYSEIQTLQTQAQSSQTTLTTALSSVQDVDMAKAETQLTTQQLTYEAALEATSKVLSTSLADFLQ
jgi:flagellar hook-associated protein 3 FlgL